MKRSLAALLCAALIAGPAGRALADAFPPAFVVADVAVDATAASGVAARDAARAQGESRALRRLLERLTAPGDWSKLPTPSAAQTTDLLQDFEVEHEREAARRYIGTYTFRFNPSGVRQLLDAAGLKYTELASKPVVLIPVLQTGASAVLWDDPNPWREAWNAADHSAGIVPWIMPAGDLDDVQTFDAPAALKPTTAQLAAISQHYDNGDPVIVAAQQAAPTAPTLQITVTRYSADGPQQSTTSVTAAKADKTLYAAGVQAALIELENDWKTKALGQSAESGAAQTVEVSAPVAGAADWAHLRDRLRLVPGVRGVSVVMFSHESIRLKLDLAAAPDSLKLALAQQDLALTPGDKYMMLTSTAAAPETTSPESTQPESSPEPTSPAPPAPADAAPAPSAAPTPP